MSYTVTDNHILTLKVRNHARNPTTKNRKFSLRWFDKDTLMYKSTSFDSKEDLEQFQSKIEDVIDITIEQYLSLPQSVQKELYLFKSDGVNWEHKPVLLDPYILGMWLGDGSSSGYAFATADKELLDKWNEWGADNDATIKKGHKYKYGISSTINNTQTGIACNKTERGPLKKLLDHYNLANNKHIPLEYLVNDRKTRLSLFAGLIDTDGHVRANGHEIRITQGERNYRIIYDAEFLARSLGFSCHLSDGTCTYSVNGEKRQRPYKELTITGGKLYEIPTVLPRKKLNKFDNPVSIKKCSSYLQSAFQLVKKDIQPFVGFQLEGNGRFLLGDMSISHNTPEGQSVGLVKNMAMMANITICSNSTNIRELVVNELEMIPFDESTNYNVRMFFEHTKVLINGDIVGVHKEPNVFYTKLKTLKRTGCINVYTSIIWNVQSNEISISTEGGRCVRPLLIVDNHTCRLTKDILDKVKKGQLSWHQLVTGIDAVDSDTSVIEYMDVEETNAAMIAMQYNDIDTAFEHKGKITPSSYTNMEIHPSLIMGVLASCIPFSDHNQAPRVAYQSSMGKQAVGIYTSNFRHRFDTMGHVLSYGQRPLVKTNMSSILNNDDLPCGINAIVAIATYTGFNQEDSVILNASSVDMGLFNSTYYRTYKELNNKNHSNGEEEYFTKPDISVVKNLKPYNYDKLDKTGFVPENTFVQAGDVIIGKVMPTKVDNNIQYKDNSSTMKNNESGFIDRIGACDRYFTNTNGDGYNFAKVRIRNDRTPTIGDKFCLLPEAEVLTKYGWKFIPEITENDLVAQLNNGKLEYVHPTKLYEFEHTGDMYQLLSQQVDLTVTMNHKMYVRKRDTKVYQLIEAKDVMGKRVHYKKDAEYSCQIQDAFTFDNNFTVPMNSWLKFLGIWMAEGWVERGAKRISFAANKPRVQKALDKICAEMGLNLIVNGDKRHVYCINMYKFLETHSVGALHKELPQFVFDIDMTQARILLEGLMLGDGYISKTNSHTYSTSSIKLANHVQQLALHCGYSANIKLLKKREATMRDGRVVRPTGEYQYAVHIIKAKNAPSVNHGHVHTQNGQSENIIQYSGKVYCIEVPSHVFYVRMNGKPVWTGNSSRHGQKGTCGMIYRQEDMPFTSGGLTPDIIVNPHAIPSRMTIGQLMECIMGKACAHLGVYGNATAFNHANVETLSEILENCGMERHGNEIMYNSRTGEQIHTEIFIGPTYYQRLKHMVNDKVHSRSSNGPVVLLSRQPAEGRSREGGLRLGEMEVECNWAYGVSQFLKERMMECSDNYRVFICKKCGLMANVNPEKNIFVCKACRNTTDFSQVRIPYAMKLLAHEVQTMSIGARFITK
jgi:hypothetical protein